MPFWQHRPDFFVIGTKDQSHEKWNQNRYNDLKIGFKRPQ
jgi:hypothetical protein